jgi:phosphinothricin acetyltransferase
VEPGVLEVNINLSPAHRGKGLSHALLGAALTAVAPREPDTIIAEIKPANLPSLRLFEAHGFRRIGTFGDIDRFVLSRRG